MPSSKLTKAQQQAMTKRQATKVQKATAAAETAADSVTALKDVRNVKRGSLANLREDLGSLQQKLNAHPLSQKVRDKKADIEVCRTELEAIVLATWTMPERDSIKPSLSGTRSLRRSRRNWRLQATTARTRTRTMKTTDRYLGLATMPGGWPR